MKIWQLPPPEETFQAPTRPSRVTGPAEAVWVGADGAAGAAALPAASTGGGILVAVTGGGGAGGGGNWLDETWPVGAGRRGVGPLSTIGDTERVQPEAARTADSTAHVF